ncbi:somatostatin receptor type 4-like [Mercenaria mercenaria]|uniref:somatostatin receptor type 4-like n=1 Tax=Mercenaria mercenaria TaxID=6596 RepID=UPI00234E633A|nr:somatostatin receptor type 4-like [Mercenaria mercenaria]
MVYGNSQINRSFFYDTDNCTVYFTYFSEFNRLWEGAAFIEAVVMSIIFLLSIFENGIIIGFIFNSRKSRTVTNFFVCNLAIGDILFVSSAPLVAYVRITGTWYLGDGMCHLLNYGMFVCSNTMIWTMVAISIDRYICIVIGIPTSRRLVPVHIVLICAGIWLTTSCCFLPTAFFFHLQDIHLDHGVITFCTLTWPSGHIHYSVLFTTMLLLLGFGLPVLIISLNYYRIFKKFWSSKRAIDTQNVSGIQRCTRTRKRKEQRIVKTLILLVVIFVLMWLPIVIVFSMIREDIENERNEMPSYGLTWALIIAYLNPCVNPFLYGFMNEEFLRKLRYCRQYRQSNEQTAVSRTNLREGQTSASNL